MAAEVGLMELAHDYLGEAALMDLNDLEHNVRDGVHMGSLAGAWIAVVAGLGGMRHHGDALSFAPRLPPAIPRLTFRITFLGRLIKVRIDHTRATYALLRGRPIEFAHHGQPVRLAARKPISRPIPAIKPPPSPKQPQGRAPARRGESRPGPRTLRPAQQRKSRLPKPVTTAGGKAPSPARAANRR
jgi:alpha,alpha-trehalose phosphorylase